MDNFLLLIIYIYFSILTYVINLLLLTLYFSITLTFYVNIYLMVSRTCILYFIYLYIIIYVLVYGLFVCNKLLN